MIGTNTEPILATQVDKITVPLKGPTKMPPDRGTFRPYCNYALFAGDAENNREIPFSFRAGRSFGKACTNGKNYRINTFMIDAGLGLVKLGSLNRDRSPFERVFRSRRIFKHRESTATAEQHILRNTMKSLVNFATKIACCLAVAGIATVGQAQEKSIDKTATVKSDAVKSTAMVDESGTLHGFVFRVDGDQKLPVEAKITLSNNGKVVETVTTDESGSFAISNVAPGAYEMFAAADDFVGTQTYEVLGFSEQYSGMAAVNMQVGNDFGFAAPATVYDGFGGGMPIDSFSSVGTPAGFGGGCGCGGGGGGGGRFFGGGRGGLGRLGRLGLIGGVVAIAVSGSPDE